MCIFISADALNKVHRNTHDTACTYVYIITGPAAKEMNQFSSGSLLATDETSETKKAYVSHADRKWSWKQLL